MRKRHAISLICNVLTVALVAYAIKLMVCMESVGEFTFGGLGAFALYTVDSNAVAAIACLCMIPANIRGLFGKSAFPHGVLLLKYVGTVTVSVTFVTVMCFLGPLHGFGPMVDGANLWLHVVCPILCIVSFMFVERGFIPFSRVFLTVIPVAVYGVVYFAMVIIVGVDAGGWRDFYGLNNGGLWYVSAVIMLAVTIAIAAIERLTHRKD